MRRSHATMKTTRTNVIGWLLIVLGVMVVVFRESIVFPGLERLVGIETIVGRENVVYELDGGYLFTNPGAMIRWVLSVGAVGILICTSGVGLWYQAIFAMVLARAGLQHGGAAIVIGAFGVLTIVGCISRLKNRR
jgi:hypothetical protein